MSFFKVFFVGVNGLQLSGALLILRAAIVPRAGCIHWGGVWYKNPPTAAWRGPGNAYRAHAPRLQRRLHSAAERRKDRTGGFMYVPFTSSPHWFGLLCRRQMKTVHLYWKRVNFIYTQKTLFDILTFYPSLKIILLNSCLKFENRLPRTNILTMYR